MCTLLYPGAAHGLSDIQELYNLNVSDLMEGKIFLKEHCGHFYQSHQRLSSKEGLTIAKEALASKYHEGYVNWLRASLKSAKAENETKAFISKIRQAITDLCQITNVSLKIYRRQMLKTAISSHDKNVLEMPAMHRLSGKHMFREKPFQHQLGSTEAFNKTNKFFDEVQSNYDNYFLSNSNVANRLEVPLRRRIQQLCRGSVSQSIKLFQQIKFNQQCF